MIIQHNIMALNSYNRLSGNNSLVSKNLEKLSSGYKINRAGDDAAGLAISEKMRAQITGLTRASQNAQDGISLVQTAEGNLTEVHSMLNRMVDLATQSSNGTYDGANGVDRTNLQKELQSLKDEIDRIATSAHFNGIKLLDGTMGGASRAAVTPTPGTDAGTAVTAVKASITMDISSLTGDGIADGATFQIGGQTVATGATATTEGAGNKAGALSAIETGLTGKTFTIGGASYTATIDKATEKITFTMAADPAEGDAVVTPTETAFNAAITDGGTAITANGTASAITSSVSPVAAGTATEATVTLDYSGKTGTDLIGSSLEIDGTKFQFVETGKQATGGATAIELANNATADDIATAIATATAGGAAGTATGATITFKSATTGVDAEAPVIKQGGGLSLQIGDTADQRVTVSVGNMGVTALGLDAVDITDEKKANASIDIIKNAINTVSSTRADLGAIQNRLEHTINNLATTTENMTAAESRIRDTDMAKEMMAFTKNNVLSQAAQAMLAQANQQPQQVLQLLR